MHYLQKLPAMTWNAKEVLLEINRKPHLMVRIRISGAYFPHRGAEPFINIRVGSKKTVSSWFVNVSSDNRNISGYFPIGLPQQGIFEFGYGSEIYGNLPSHFRSEAILRLDPERFPKNTAIITRQYLENLVADSSETI